LPIVKNVPPPNKLIIAVPHIQPCQASSVWNGVPSGLTPTSLTPKKIAILVEILMGTRKGPGVTPPSFLLVGNYVLFHVVGKIVKRIRLLLLLILLPLPSHLLLLEEHRHLLVSRG